MQTEQLRALLLEYLSNVPNNGHENLQYRTCLSKVTELARNRCLEALVPEGEHQCLHDDDKNRLKHVIWDLIIDRVLIPGTTKSEAINDGWPHLSLTDHGRKVVSSQQPTPYDPDGYLGQLENDTGGLHPTVAAYLSESVSTLRTGNHLASAVMLGAASEMLFIELCDAIAAAYKCDEDRRKFKGKTGYKKKMMGRVNAVTTWLLQKRAQLPPDWRSQERVNLVNSVADLIRRLRNDAGHPADPPARPLHECMYAHLIVFASYCKTLYTLINWLKANQEKIT